ncbi:MAG: RagB/SusD family nutrient uptake outer membrane protein, partial [Bacteroidales bacterium]|nr:RagB/SusD family nutrient uptake outer membrane protein [Bacteroidales bacterium]
MKNILYIGIFFLAVVLSSCSDFLNKESFTDPSPEYINDEATLIALVNGAYQPLQRPKLYNMRIWTLDIMAGNSEVGAGGGDDGIETIQLSNFVT